jgi:hypothetical protein
MYLSEYKEKDNSESFRHVATTFTLPGYTGRERGFSTGWRGV